MVTELATRPKVCRSNLVESNGFLRVIKIYSTTSFGGEIKPSAMCLKILRHVKVPLRYDRY
jgi:hypothetical protein